MKTMKAVNVTELKAHLSRYLRLASRGARIAVKDRDEAIAELGPPSSGSTSWRDRLALAGRLRLGTQKWATLRISEPGVPVDVQSSLRAVREDPSEVRRR
jgi:antitoxin (DNA-binding transcriptional repressor) of toxin-antitoxin stability system